MSVQTPTRRASAPEPGGGKPKGLGSQLVELSRHSVIYGVGGLMSRFLAIIMLPLYTSYVSAGDYGRARRSDSREILPATLAHASLG